MIQHYCLAENKEAKIRGIKINKMAAMWLVLVAEVGQATKPALLRDLWKKYIEQEFYISGDYPKVGDIFEIVYRIKLKSEVEPKSGDYWAVLFCGPLGP